MVNDAWQELKSTTDPDLKALWLMRWQQLDGLQKKLVEARTALSAQLGPSEHNHLLAHHCYLQPQERWPAQSVLLLCCK
jgi:hypothetical protein